MEIKKAKILKSKKDAGVRMLEVEYVTIDKDGKEDYHTDNCGGAIHEDLYNAFQELAVHFGLITEIIPADQVQSADKYDKGLTERLFITSFSYGGKDEDPGVTISGYKLLKTGRTMHTSVYQKIEESEDGYDHVIHLNKSLKVIKKEIQEYTDGKYAEDPQPELPFGQSENNGDGSKTTVNVLETEEGSAFQEDKPKRGKKKAAATE